MWSGKKRTLLAVLFMISLFTLSSCTKKNDSTSNKDDNANDEKVAVSDSNFKETNEDLLTVDYKKFYDELAPHGDWVQVSAKDLGIDLKKGEGSGESSILNDLIGVKEAYADNADFGMFFVWRPSPELAVAVSTVEPPVYVPYTRGQWVYTDAGWYFRAPTPYEEITVHYGRWVFSPAVGWVWVPGRVWAPAWVDWYQDDDYIGWAPLPPGAYIVDYGVPPVFIDNTSYIFVEKYYFTEPDIYTHCYFYNDNPDRFNIKEMTRVDGITVNNNIVINRGPDVTNIEKITGRKFDPVKVNRVDNIRNAKYAGGEMNSYSPHFSKVKGNDRKESVTKPNNFVSYDHAESKSKNEKSAFNHQERNAGSSDNNKASRNYGSNKNNKGNNEQFKGSNKQNNDQMTKGNRKNDYKQKDNNSGNQEQFRRKTNDNNKGSQQKENKPKGNDKGYQQPKGNDKGYQQPKGNDKGNRQKQSNGYPNGNNSNGNGNDRGSNQPHDNGHGRGKH